jgi:hypothetical protein
MPVMPEVLPGHVRRHAVIAAGNIAAVFHQGRNFPLQFCIDRAISLRHDALIDTANDLEARKRLANLSVSSSQNLAGPVTPTAGALILLVNWGEFITSGILQRVIRITLDRASE